MKSTVRGVTVIIGVALVAMLAGNAVADDELRDKLTAHLKPGASPNSAIVEFWMSNTNPVLAMTLPFKFAAGDSLAFDSIVTRGGLIADFPVVEPVYRSENQTLLVQIMWAKNTSVQADPIPPGQGPLLRLHLSTPGEFPMDDFRMASVQLPPENVLMFVTATLNSVTPDFELTRKAPPASWGETAQQPKSDGSE
ncbi:MAG: hypothetical protein GF341_07435 [candidate division Zixibacteria bacterium]|nr:hypothetical protein [candidate division Zixibacteria bacterium]